MTLAPIATPTSLSPLRRVFESPTQRTAFTQFLETIFYQLDTNKVLEGMEDIFLNRTDEEVYVELLNRIGSMRKSFAPLWQLHALSVLKQGIGAQAAALLKPFQKNRFKDYLELYFRRHYNDIRKAAAVPLNGRVIAASDTSSVSLLDRIQAGAPFFQFPYKTHIPLNDPDCTDPLTQPEKTHKPIDPGDVPDKSLDLVACLGGLHHIPPERIEPFVASLSRTLRPGAVLLLRDHNATTPELRDMASSVHTFVNAAGGVAPDIEKNEVREFKPLSDWSNLLKRHQLTPLPTAPLVLPGDPTENGMIAFVKTPQTLDEIRQAASYSGQGLRPTDGSAATWIEWGNVRFAQSFANFIQTHHAYEFDHIGHLRQHWQHFFQYLKAGSPLTLDGMSMNLFILIGATLQCALGYLASLPARAMARPNAPLSHLERAEAALERDYCRFIEHTPFYRFPYLSRIRALWSAAHADRTASSYLSALSDTAGLLLKATVSTPIRTLFSSESLREPETVSVLLHDPENRLASYPTLLATPDNYKLILVPRYRPFTQFCTSLDPSIQLLSVGGQTTLSLSTFRPHPSFPPTYSLPRLQDSENRVSNTYRLAVQDLQAFIASVGRDSIEQIYE